MKNLTCCLSLIIASVSLANPTPPSANIPGFVTFTIRQGTNQVSNLPFTNQMLPELRSVGVAKPGDTFVWKGEAHTFDGKAWSGPEGGKALVPIHESFKIIRTANATDKWDIGGCLDLGKMEKWKQ